MRKLPYFREIRHIARNLYYCFKLKHPISLALLCDVDVSKIPENTFFSHPIGIVIRTNVQIGENCTIGQHVTIGQRKYEPDGAIIGSNVLICAHTLILGDVAIGDNAIIGAGALVLKDVPAGKVVVGVWK